MLKQQYKTLLIAGIVTILLTACGGNDDSGGPPPAAGLWYANRGGGEISYSLIQEAFASAKTCTGLDGPGTKVLTVATISGCSLGANACYSDNGVIEMITPDYELDSLVLLEHEFIHYLLHVNTNNLYPDHNHEAFDRCDPL